MAIFNSFLYVYRRVSIWMRVHCAMISPYEKHPSEVSRKICIREAPDSSAPYSPTEPAHLLSNDHLRQAAMEKNGTGHRKFC